MSDLTKQEQDNVRRALRFLRARLGTWDAVAAALDAHPKTLELARTRGGVSASMTFRVARVAGVGVDDILSGKYAPDGVCPNCGEKLPE